MTGSLGVRPFVLIENHGLRQCAQPFQAHLPTATPTLLYFSCAETTKLYKAATDDHSYQMRVIAALMSLLQRCLYLCSLLETLTARLGAL